MSKINRKRTSTKISELTISRTPTGGTTDGDVILFVHRSGSTSFGGTSNVGGGARAENEFNLKSNTKYVISATTFADVYVTLNLNWYENL